MQKESELEKATKEKDAEIKARLKIFSFRALLLVVIFSIAFYLVPEKITLSIIAGIALLLLWDQIGDKSYRK